MRQITTIVSSVQRPAKQLGVRERLILLEIGTDKIDSASAFVSYLSESYGFSKSSVWYNLNRLKEIGMLEFATKDEPGKLLSLTYAGLKELRRLAQEGVRLEDFEAAAPLVDASALDERNRGQSVPLHNPFAIGTFGR